MRLAPPTLRLPLLVSLLAHAAILHFVSVPAPPLRQLPLEARLLAPVPLPPPPEPELRPPPSPLPDLQARSTKPAPQPAPHAVPRAAPTPVIALPAQPEAPPTSFSVPAPPPEPPPPTRVATAPAAPTAVEPPQVAAAYLDNPKPAYPAIARRRRLEGTVLLEVLVSAEGRPIDLRLAESSGSAILDDAALGAVRGWRFVPAKRRDQPVEAQLRVPIRFRLDD